MENRQQPYRDKLDEQLQILEGQIEGVREKMALATAQGKAEMERLVERWKESSLEARRRLAELTQGDPVSETIEKSTDRMWDELKALVDQAKAAF